MLGNNTWLLNLTRAAHPGDWHVLADGDERQLYPDGLTRAIAYCEEHGYDYIQGAFVDRLASDGQLTAIREDLPLSEQYPLGAMLSARVLGAVVNKVVAARGSVRVSHGQHVSYSGSSCPVGALYVQVHHYKWHAGSLEQLRRCSNHAGMYSDECRRFLDYFSTHGRILTEDPALLAAPCSPAYPHWQTVCGWRELAAWFAPELAAMADPPATGGQAPG